MRKVYRYTFDKRTKRITAAISLVLAGVIAFLSFYSISGFLPAWFLTFGAAVLALYVLSIPKYGSLEEHAVEIDWMVELTRIAVEDVETIRRMDRREMKYAVPLLGSYGFFGYYGYYYGFSEMSCFKVYATAWKDFVRIEDIYEDIYVINCDDADDLIRRVLEAKAAKREQEEAAEAAGSSDEED